MGKWEDLAIRHDHLLLKHKISHPWIESGISKEEFQGEEQDRVEEAQDVLLTQNIPKLLRLRMVCRKVCQKYRRIFRRTLKEAIKHQAPIDYQSRLRFIHWLKICPLLLRKKLKHKVTYETLVLQSVMRFMMQLWVKLWPGLTMMPKDHEMYQWVGLAEKAQSDIHYFIGKIRRVPRRHTQSMTIADSDSEGDEKRNRLWKIHGGRHWMNHLWEQTRRAELESALETFPTMYSKTILLKLQRGRLNTGQGEALYRRAKSEVPSCLLRKRDLTRDRSDGKRVLLRLRQDL